MSIKEKKTEQLLEVISTIPNRSKKYKKRPNASLTSRLYSRVIQFVDRILLLGLFTKQIKRAAKSTHGHFVLP